MKKLLFGLVYYGVVVLVMGLYVWVSYSDTVKYILGG